MSPFWSTNSARSGSTIICCRAVAESTLFLENGCLCCAVRGDLQQALRNLLSQRTRGEVPHFRRVVIETSGLADPSPIAYTLLSEPVLRHHFRLSGIITTVDAVNGAFATRRICRSGQASVDGRSSGGDQDGFVGRAIARGRCARGYACSMALRRFWNRAEIRGEVHQVLTDDIYDAAGKFREARHWVAEEVDARRGRITPRALRLSPWFSIGPWIGPRSASGRACCCTVMVPTCFGLKVC